VQRNTISEIQFTIEAAASSPSQSVIIATHEKHAEKKKRQLLHRMRRISSSSNPREYSPRITLELAETAGPAQHNASRHIQGTGQVDSPIDPGWRQQHPPYIP